MKNFKEIAEKIINKAISGTFILRNGDKINSKYLKRYYTDYPYPYSMGGIAYSADGMYYTNGLHNCDVVYFIPDTKYLNHIESAVSLLNCVFAPPQYFKNEDGIIYKLVGKEENFYVFENMHNGSIVYKTAYQATKLISTDSILENVLNGMKENELKITIPENHEIDWQESAKQEKIVFKKKDSKPRSWEEYCDNVRGEIYYIQDDFKSNINTIFSTMGLNNNYKNYAPSKELAEAFLAMMQLMSLRQAWIGDWKPDWKNINQEKAYIVGGGNDFIVSYFSNINSRPLSFPTQEMAEDFMNTFKDLLETAKPLI